MKVTEVHVELLVKLLAEVKEYIEKAEIFLESEWGECIGLSQLLKNNDMPDIYYKVCDLMKEFKIE